MVTLNLIALLLVSTVLISVFRNKYVRITLSIIFGVFFVLEASSLYLGGSFIDYRYYLHFNFNALSMAGAFKKEIVLAVLLLASAPTLLFFVSRPNFPKSKKRQLVIKSTVFVAAMLVLTASTDGVFSKLKEIYNILSTPVTNDFSEFSDGTDISDDKQPDTLNLEAPEADSSKLNRQQQAAPIIFTRKENLRAKFGGKNIVIISLESFEKAFLHDANKHLTPNLRRRARQWPFYEMKQNYGSGWTAGSLYTVLTGLPSYFVGNGNYYFFGTKKSKLISLCDILQRGGYEQYHLSNDATFAGTQDMLTTFGVDHIVDGENIMKYEDGKKCPYGGPWDKDVFNRAKDIVHQMDSIHKPFMLWISTIQTHHPDGAVDERMLEFVEKQESNLETAALSTDWLVEDFLSFLERKGLMKNTVVYLFPDHLLHSYNKKILDKTNEPRSLWFMTNADEQDLHIDTSNFYQIDIIGNILSGAKIKHNAKFLADFIHEDKEEFISRNVQLITAINTASTIREQTLGESFHLNRKGRKLTCMVNRDILFEQDIDSIRWGAIYLLLDKTCKIISIKHTNDDIYDFYYSYIKISIKGTLICFDWIKDDDMFHYQQNASEIKMDSKGINAIVRSITPYEINGGVGNVFNGGVVKYAPMTKDSALVKYLSVVLEDSSKVVMMSCSDDASIYFGKLKPILEKAGLKESLEGKFGGSYLAAFSNHEVYCEKAAESIGLHKRFAIGNTSIYLASNGLNSYSQPYSAQHIVINYQEYSLGKRGLNIAIFDTKSQKVIDAFNVDLFGDETLTINR
jgi:phosphoglycerol transferase